MGGHGSGRWGAHTKAMTVESCFALSVRDLRAHGVFKGAAWASSLTRSQGGRTLEQAGLHLVAQGLESGRARLVVELGRIRQEVEMEERAVFRFGGRSWWLACPGCMRQCLKLYLPPGAWACPSPFRCRSCWRLTYAAAQEAHYWDRGWSALGLSELAGRLGISLQEVVKAIRTSPTLY